MVVLAIRPRGKRAGQHARCGSRRRDAAQRHRRRRDEHGDARTTRMAWWWSFRAHDRSSSFPDTVRAGILTTAYSNPAIQEGRAIVTINGGGGLARLYGWVDSIRDGDFGDADEQIADGSTTRADGVHNVDFDVPATAVTGADKPRRFRATTRSVSCESRWTVLDGEVEDYLLNIVVTFENTAPDQKKRASRYLVRNGHGAGGIQPARGRSRVLIHTDFATSGGCDRSRCVHRMPCACRSGHVRLWRWAIL